MLLQPFQLRAQIINEPLSSKHVYNFIDEMVLEGHLDFNQSVKPYSKKVISKGLLKVNDIRSELNNRQQKELDYFLHQYKLDYDSTQIVDHILKKPLQKFNPFKLQDIPFNMFVYNDSVFQLKVNPIIGMETWSNSKEFFYHRWNGLSAETTLKDHWGFYVRFWDNLETVELEHKQYLTQRQGANYKGNEYLRLKAGFSYSWKWGSLGLFYDDMQWGTGYNGTNILSGKSPAFAQLRLNMQPVDWLELNYMHGWLYSMVLDSSYSYPFTPALNYKYREVWRPKYIATNLISISPFSFLNISLGNSIIYGDYNIQPAYLIPVMVFRIADNNLEAGSNYAGNNSQMFLDINVYPFKRFHAYSSLFIDEISFSRMWDEEQHSNYLSWKSGFRWSNIRNSNVTFTFEYTRTNPEVYKHVLPTTDYESNNYTLGHYLKDNAQEIYASIQYKPLARVITEISYTNIKKGPDYQDIGAPSRWGLPFLSPVIFESNSLNFNVSYLIKNNVSIFGGFQYRNNIGDMSFVPDVYHGKSSTFNLGLNWGL